MIEQAEQIKNDITSKKWEVVKPSQLIQK